MYSLAIKRDDHNQLICFQSMAVLKNTSFCCTCLLDCCDVWLLNNSCVGQTSLSILAKGLKASVRNMVDHTGKESVITPDNY
jgi:hypothetical protein